MLYRLQNLGIITDAEVAQAFAAAPVGVTSLDLSLNGLGTITGAQLTQAFAAIPAGVTSLDLGANDLDSRTGAELAEAFAAIPAGVTSLDLGENDLGRRTGAELAEAFATIPAGLTSLNLSWNDLGSKTGAELAEAFAAIPAGVTFLDLSGNNLGRRTGAELAQAFVFIPAGVRKIALSEEDITTRSAEELSALAELMLNIEIFDYLGRPSNHAKAIEFKKCINEQAKARQQQISEATGLPDELVNLILSAETGANEKGLRQLVKKDRMDISMQVLGGFIAAIGCAVVAMAFTLLNTTTFGISGLIVSGIGVTTILAGVGLFASGTDRNKQEEPSIFSPDASARS